MLPLHSPLHRNRLPPQARTRKSPPLSPRGAPAPPGPARGHRPRGRAPHTPTRPLATQALEAPPPRPHLRQSRSSLRRCLRSRRGRHHGTCTCLSLSLSRLPHRTPLPAPALLLRRRVREIAPVGLCRGGSRDPRRGWLKSAWIWCFLALCTDVIAVFFFCLWCWWAGDGRAPAAAPVGYQGNLNPSSSDPFGFLLLVLSRR